MKVSPSSLKLYQQCPRAYKFRYIDKLPVKNKPVLVMANNVHSALKEFFLIPRLEERTLERLENILRTVWQNNLQRKEVFPTVLEEQKWGLKALAMLRKFFFSFDCRVRPFALEEFCQVEIEKDLILWGKVDRVDLTPQGGMCIIDYKTGQAPKDEEAFLAQDLQLGIYGIILQNYFQREVERILYLFLEDGREIGISPSKEYLAEVLEKVKSIAENMRQDRVYFPTPGSFCKLCDFLESCEAGIKEKANTKEIEGEELPF
jgi:RecB family exonuclease